MSIYKEIKYILDILDIAKTGKWLKAKGIQLKHLALFHALSGSDTTSFSYGIGKLTAWAAFVEHHYLLDSIDVQIPSDEDYLYVPNVW